MRFHTLRPNIESKVYATLASISKLVGVSASVKYWLEEGSGSGEKIALVEVLGVIKDSRDMVDQISRYRRDPSILGIIVRIDSPGGAVAPSQEIYNEVLKTRKKKKIIARYDGYHGITISSGSLTGLPLMHKGFDLPIRNFLHTGYQHWPIWITHHLLSLEF